MTRRRADRRAPGLRHAATDTSCRGPGGAAGGWGPPRGPAARTGLPPTRATAPPGQEPQRLGVALEATLPSRQFVEYALPVVAERGMPQVMRERGCLGEVGMTTQRPGQVTGHLCDLQAVREPVADEVVGLRSHDLGLGRQPARGGGVHDPGAIPLERRPHGRGDPLGGLGDAALSVRVVVQVIGAHRGTPYPGP